LISEIIHLVFLSWIEAVRNEIKKAGPEKEKARTTQENKDNTREKEKERTVGFVWPRKEKTTHHQPSQQKWKKAIEKDFHLLSIVVASAMSRLRHTWGCLQLLERRALWAAKS
jgi:hypothetical protein